MLGITKGYDECLAEILEDTVYCEVSTSSKLKSTPPIGAPNATDTPAAAAADKTYRSHKHSMQWWCYYRS